MESFDVAVIGAGIAGASVARELAEHRTVALIEREPQPGYHTTGRSAALFSQIYGPPAIRALSRASAAFFEAPPAGFSDHALLTSRGVMMIARADQENAMLALHDEVASRGGVHLLDARAVRQRVPLLREGYAAGAVCEQDARDIDVHGLHQGYLRHFRAAGGSMRTSGEVEGAQRHGHRWALSTRSGSIVADVVVNAAGAWADEVAALFGAAPVGLVPKRRTALVVTAPEGIEPNGWPMTVDVDERFYLKPDAGWLLISPADETPSPPCDARPEELDIAVCVERIQTAFDLDIRHIENKWAGLRSFVADKTPVAGYDPLVPGFFWLAGQGGYGIQSAPALARAAAALVCGGPLPPDIADQGVSIDALAVQRLEQAA